MKGFATIRHIVRHVPHVSRRQHQSRLQSHLIQVDLKPRSLISTSGQVTMYPYYQKPYRGLLRDIHMTIWRSALHTEVEVKPSTLAQARAPPRGSVVCPLRLYGQIDNWRELCYDASIGNC